LEYPPFVAAYADEPRPSVATAVATKKIDLIDMASLLLRVR
jgi:hypothetical protein